MFLSQLTSSELQKRNEKISSPNVETIQKRVRTSFSSPFSTCLRRRAPPVQTLETLAGSTETDVPVIAPALAVVYPGRSETSYQGEEIISPPVISQLIHILFPTQLVPSFSSRNGLSFWKDEQRKRKGGKKSEAKQKSRLRAGGCLANRLLAGHLVAFKMYKSSGPDRTATHGFDLGKETKSQKMTDKTKTRFYGSCKVKILGKGLHSPTSSKRIRRLLSICCDKSAAVCFRNL